MQIRVPRGIQRVRHWAIVLTGALALLACDKSNKGGPTDGGASSGGSSLSVPVVEGAQAKGTGQRLFDPEDKGLAKRACEVLTASMVSELFDVPAEELKQFKVMGCIYTLQKDGQLVDAKLMSMRVHKSVESAGEWLQNATASKTKKQLDTEMDAIKGKVQERKEVDTQLKKKTAGDLTDIAKMSTPDEGISYEAVAGIGDDARVSNADGVMWVRLGNLTFHVAAFKGPEQPRPTIDPKNLKGIAKAAMDAQKKWIKETLEQRKKDAALLAPRIVKAFASEAK